MVPTAITPRGPPRAHGLLPGRGPRPVASHAPHALRLRPPPSPCVTVTPVPGVGRGHRHPCPGGRSWSPSPLSQGSVVVTVTPVPGIGHCQLRPDVLCNSACHVHSPNCRPALWADDPCFMNEAEAQRARATVEAVGPHGNCAEVARGVHAGPPPAGAGRRGSTSQVCRRAAGPVGTSVPVQRAVGAPDGFLAAGWPQPHAPTTDESPAVLSGFEG